MIQVRWQASCALREGALKETGGQFPHQYCWNVHCSLLTIDVKMCFPRVWTRYVWMWSLKTEMLKYNEQCNVHIHLTFNLFVLKSHSYRWNGNRRRRFHRLRKGAVNFHAVSVIFWVISVAKQLHYCEVIEEVPRAGLGYNHMDVPCKATRCFCLRWRTTLIILFLLAHRSICRVRRWHNWNLEYTVGYM